MIAVQHHILCAFSILFYPFPRHPEGDSRKSDLLITHPGFSYAQVLEYPAVARDFPDSRWLFCKALNLKACISDVIGHRQGNLSDGNLLISNCNGRWEVPVDEINGCFQCYVSKELFNNLLFYRAASISFQSAHRDGELLIRCGLPVAYPNDGVLASYLHCCRHPLGKPACYGHSSRS